MKKGTTDFVIPWVDGNDPEWKARKGRYLGTDLEDDRAERYRDWDLLRFWFRGVENFAPWVRKVWFVCDQEPPAWLNREHPKLEIVRHEDYLPAEYRPAFSANPIELNFHRIKGLSEQFVYFNDDMFLLRPVKESFFFKNGLPRDQAVMNPVPTTEIAERGNGTRIFTAFLNNTEYLNRDFAFYSTIRNAPVKWLHPVYGTDAVRNLVLLAWPRFLGFAEEHLPVAYLKSSYTRAWEADFDILDATSRHTLRNDHDVTQWFIRTRQLAEGNFVPRKRRKDAMFRIHEDQEAMHAAIREQKLPLICLNDDKSMEESTFQELKQKLKDDFEVILGEKSTFESK